MSKKQQNQVSANEKLNQFMERENIRLVVTIEKQQSRDTGAWYDMPAVNAVYTRNTDS